MGQAISALLADALRLVIVVLGGYAAAYVRSHYTSSQVQRAERIGRTAVWAVEQLAAATGWDGRGKASRALAFAKRLAGRAGLRLSDEEWQTILEAAVRALQQEGAEVTKAPPSAPAATSRPSLAATGTNGAAGRGR